MRLLGEPLALLDRLHLVVVAHRQPVLHEVRDLMAGVEREEGLELPDGLVEVAVAIMALADQEAGARGVRRGRVALDDLLEALARFVVALLCEVVLAFRVELLRRQDRRRCGPEPAAAARRQEQAGEEHAHARGWGTKHEIGQYI